MASGPVETRVTAPQAFEEKVLMVAVDESEQALWASQVAARLAEALHADVVLVYVMNLEAAGASELAFNDREYLAQLRGRADQIFAAARARFPPGVNVQRLLREGKPAKEIIASAVEWGPALLLIGTHGRGRLATFVLGSTAEEVIRGAPCPVLTVAHDPGGTPPPPSCGSTELMSIVP